MNKPGRFRENYYRIEGQGTAEHPLVPEGITELRTHGVSGAPPEDLVNDPHPLFVSGDDKAGFYRRLGPPEIGPERTVEAYSWAAINSRSSSRAFWLLLFPFAMVNHAGWMVGPKADGTFERALIRVLGLLLTVHYTLWAMVVFVDLFAYQCGRSEVCRGRYLLGWFNSITEFVGPNIIRQLIVFSAIPALVLLLLMWTGRSDPTNYERWREGKGRRGESDDLVDLIPLRDPDFWQAPESTRLLALSHGLAAMSAVSATLAGSVLALSSRHVGPLKAVELGLWAIAAVSVAQAVGVCRLRKDGSGRWRLVVRVAGLALGGLTATLVVLAWNLPAPTGELPATLDILRNWFDGVMVAELAVVMVFFAKDQIRMFAAIPLIGTALFFSLDRTEQELAGGGCWMMWLAGSVAAGLAGLALYTARNRFKKSVIKLDGTLEPDDPEHHLNNQFWISFGLAPVFLAAVLAVRSAPNLATRSGAALAGAGICFVYLFSAARVQIRRAHDYAPRWKLRVGGPGTLAAVGATALTLVSAAVIVFTAQRLGSAVPVGRTDSAAVFGAVETPIGYYDELGWIATAGLGALIVFVLAFQTRIAGLWRFRFKPEVPKIAARMSDLPDRHRKELPTKVARARMFSCLIDDLDWLVTVGIVAFMACSVSVIAGQYLGRSADALDSLVGFASWLLVSIAFLVIWVVRGAQKDTGLRKAIGTSGRSPGFSHADSTRWRRPATATERFPSCAIA